MSSPTALETLTLGKCSADAFFKIGGEIELVSLHHNRVTSICIQGRLSDTIENVDTSAILLAPVLRMFCLSS